MTAAAGLPAAAAALPEAVAALPAAAAATVAATTRLWQCSAGLLQPVQSAYRLLQMSLF